MWDMIKEMSSSGDHRSGWKQYRNNDYIVEVQGKNTQKQHKMAWES